MNPKEPPGVALITGASSGIGALYADRLARRGYDLILIARSLDRLSEVAERVARDTGRAIGTLAADLNDPAGLARVEDRLRADPSITMLVNNAGVGAVSPLLESDVEQIDRMISLNVTALTRLTYAAAPGFAARGRGALINLSSIVAIAPELLNGAYGASKAYVLAFTQSLHHELADKGVRVQAVLPGATSTAFWDVAGMPVDHLPADWVMNADSMVDAALAGFDLGEVVTIPPLADGEEWDRYEAARRAMADHLSSSAPAERYSRVGVGREGTVAWG